MGACLSAHYRRAFVNDVVNVGGAEEITLTVSQIPAHSHPVLGSMAVANDQAPGQNVLAQTGTFDGYQSSPPTAAMAPQAVGAVGGSQPHTNFQPYLCVDFIISLYGIFPSPT